MYICRTKSKKIVYVICVSSIVKPQKRLRIRNDYTVRKFIYYTQQFNHQIVFHVARCGYSHSFRGLEEVHSSVDNIAVSAARSVGMVLNDVRHLVEAVVAHASANIGLVVDIHQYHDRAPHLLLVVVDPEHDYSIGLVDMIVALNIRLTQDQLADVDADCVDAVDFQVEHMIVALNIRLPQDQLTHDDSDYGCLDPVDFQAVHVIHVHVIVALNIRLPQIQLAVFCFSYPVFLPAKASYLPPNHSRRNQCHQKTFSCLALNYGYDLAAPNSALQNHIAKEL